MQQLSSIYRGFNWIHTDNNSYNYNSYTHREISVFYFKILYETGQIVTIMIGGSDEALAQCLQAEEEARLRRCLDEEMRSEALARQLLQEEKSAQGNHTKSSFPNSKPLSSQLDEDERLARRLAEADGSTTSASSKEVFNLNTI